MIRYSAIRVAAPRPGDPTVRLEVLHGIMPGESLLLDPEVAWRIALEMLACCQDADYPPGIDRAAAIDRLAELAGLIGPLEQDHGDADSN
jgi:hypothetical protein